MTIKVSIIPNPTFKKTVKIPGAGGAVLELECEFIHRRAADLEKWVAGDGAEGRSDTDTVLGCVKSWSAEQEFNRENVEALCEGWSQAAIAISATYVIELKHARLGN